MPIEMTRDSLDLARDYLREHWGEHLAPDQIKIVDRAVEWLTGEHHVSRARAWEAAATAYADRLSDGREWIDCDNSNGRVVFVRIPSHGVVAFPLATLIAFANEQPEHVIAWRI